MKPGNRNLRMRQHSHRLRQSRARYHRGPLQKQDSRNPTSTLRHPRTRELLRRLLHLNRIWRTLRNNRPPCHQATQQAQAQAHPHHFPETISLPDIDTASKCAATYPSPANLRWRAPRHLLDVLFSQNSAGTPTCQNQWNRGFSGSTCNAPTHLSQNGGDNHRNQAKGADLWDDFDTFNSTARIACGELVITARVWRVWRAWWCWAVMDGGLMGRYGRGGFSINFILMGRRGA